MNWPVVPEHRNHILSTDIGKQTLEFGVRHGVPLGEIAQRGTKLAVRSTVLADDIAGQLGVRRSDLHRVL